ncbi:MAG: chorismate mutase [Clostridia bacterium]|nr:chorismate mutase [Clostridia bacterium]
MNELEEARKIINEVDKEMASLFERRMYASELVAKYKKEHGLSILDEAREKEVIIKNSALVENQVYREYYTEFLKETMRISRAYQSRLNEGLRVAYSGVEGAYAYIASKRMYPQGQLVSYPNFESAYRAVENGECDVAVLPIENSYAGEVSTVMDLMFSSTLYVNQVINLPISHCLMANEGIELSDIKRVVSHPQALAQCEPYIKELQLSSESMENTAVSAKYVKENKLTDTGAIASRETAELFGLKVLASGINSSRTNTTRFVAFSRAQNNTTSQGGKMEKHFILVFTVRNEAGALAKTIDIIGAHGFNMQNLHSRPMKELLWKYYFYVELNGDINTQNGRDMLRELSATCDKLKLVGTYTINSQKQEV